MIILDTNVISELMRPGVNAIDPWLRSTPAAILHITAISRAETRYGIERLPDSARRRGLDQRATEFFASISERTLPFEAAAADRFGVLVASRDAQGRPMSIPDAQIAAIALVHRATVATRNTRDFEGIGLTLVNPFTWEPHRT